MYRLKVPAVIYIILSFGLLVGCMDEKQVSVNGKLMVSGSLANDAHQTLLLLDLNNGHVESSELFAEELASNSLYYPVFREGELLYIVNDHGTYYIRSVDAQGEKETLLVSQEEITTFNFNQDTILYIVEDNKGNAQLLSHDRSSKFTKEIYYKVDKSSQPSFTNQQEILFVAEVDNEHELYLIDNQGKLTHLARGRFPIILSNGQIIYQEYTSLFALENGKKQLLKKNIQLFTTPILSSDEEWMVLSHWTLKYEVFIDERSLFSLLNKKVYPLDSYSRIKNKGSGATWVN